MSAELARLWVIDPSMAHAETEGVDEVVGDWSGEVRVIRPVLRPGDGPSVRDGYDFDGVVLMGSRASVHDDHDWLRELQRWFAPLVTGEVDRPVLGICFGHQLIAHVAGAPVGLLDASGGKRLGVEQTAIDHATLVPERAAIPVVVSHREEVKGCPPGYRVVARRPGVAYDGLEHERGSVFAFQFHPEARAQFAGTAGIAPETIDEEVRRENRRLLAAFRDRVAASKRAGSL